MRKIFLFLSVLLSNFSFCQKITNVVMVGPKGITNDVEKATSFIIVKEYPDGHFERLDYTKGGPMIMLRSYKDPDLKVMDGRYMTYAENGSLEVLGKYSDNQKTGKWLSFNDTGKVIKTTRYDHDTIVMDNGEGGEDSVSSYPDEREASFQGGHGAWQKYILRSLEKSQTADKAFGGGTVYVSFRIDPEGTVQDVFISKSVEFIIDEESAEIIKKSPKWIPAFQNGKHVSAYRRQPMTFMKP